MVSDSQSPHGGGSAAITYIVSTASIRRRSKLAGCLEFVVSYAEKSLDSLDRGGDRMTAMRRKVSCDVISLFNLTKK